MDGEASISRRGFAFSTRQSIFIMSFRVKEYWKISAYRLKSCLQHLLFLSANYNPIILMGLKV
jgi:hypothetical protein